MHRHSLLLITGIIIVLFLLFGGKIFRLITDTPPYADPQKTAQWIIDGNRDPAYCLRLLPGLPDFIPVSRPTTEELRASCVFSVAGLSHNPSACELLMPSEYGWSCLGIAQKTGDPCSINYGRYVSWAEKPYEDIRKATMEECQKGKTQTEKGQKCCHILLLSSEKGVDDCTRFKGDNLYWDLCLMQLAMKLGQRSICEEITDGNKKSICEIQVKYKGTLPGSSAN